MKVRVKKEMRYVAMDKKMLAYRIQKRFLFWWKDIKDSPIAFTEQAAEQLLDWYRDKK